MGLMLAICNPHPNWMPMNPKLMFQISQKLKFLFSIVKVSRCDVVRLQKYPDVTSCANDTFPLPRALHPQNAAQKKRRAWARRFSIGWDFVSEVGASCAVRHQEIQQVGRSNLPVAVRIERTSRLTRARLENA